MKNAALRLVICIGMKVSSFSMTIVFYIIVSNLELLAIFPEWSRALALLALFYILAYACLSGLRKMEDDETILVQEITPYEPQAVPAFVGMFVASLNIGSLPFSAVATVLLVMFLFWLIIGRVSYYNPFFSFFGYRFYEVDLAGDEHRYVILITKRKWLGKGLKLRGLKRINDYSYIEVE